MGDSSACEISLFKELQREGTKKLSVSGMEGSLLSEVPSEEEVSARDINVEFVPEEELGERRPRDKRGTLGNKEDWRSIVTGL